MKTSLAATVPGSPGQSHSISQVLASGFGPLAVECPKCGKHSIVERSPNRFDCLNCNFYKALPPVSSPAARSQRTFQEITQVCDHSSELQSELQPPSPYRNIALSSDPQPLLEPPPLESLEEAASADTSGPLIFAVIAVLLGILFL
jgi:hypothetical protein